MRSIDRQAWFPRSGPDELSVLSWNLLAEAYYKGYPCQLDWETQRLPLQQQWLARFAGCDILCFQEVDRERMLGALQDYLAGFGFAAVVQDRGGFPVVNVTFFKESRFQLAWADHRSRALLTGLTLQDGRQLGLLNVHLEAGAEQKNEVQRVAQLKSAMDRVQRRKPWCVVACGDFNSDLSTDLATILTEAGMHKVPSSGFTLRHCGYEDVLDHVWAGAALRAKAFLRSSDSAMIRIGSAGLPDREHPSDHLPVAAMFSIEQAAVPDTAKAPPVVQTPAWVSQATREEWAKILRLADAGPATKASRKQQRRLEAAFLSALEAEEATALRRWREEAASAARALVDGAVMRACVAARAAAALRSPLEKPTTTASLPCDGAPAQMCPWQGG